MLAPVQAIFQLLGTDGHKPPWSLVLRWELLQIIELTKFDTHVGLVDFTCELF